MQRRFREGFYIGLAIAIAFGVYLAWLWQPARQIGLHTETLIEQIEERDWETFTELLASDFQDQWGHDRATLTSRLREISRYMRGAKIIPQNPVVTVENASGQWIAKITIEGEGEAVSLVKDRINPLAAPFQLEWRRASRKPWDWKLTKVSNPELEIGREFY